MKTGFNLLLWTTHVTDEHLPLLGKLKAAGYDGVEVPIFEGEVAHFRKLGQALKDEGLACTSVTVMPDAAHSAIHPDPKSRQGAIEHLAWTIECSQALGSEVLCGPFHQELAVFSGEGPTADEIAWASRCTARRPISPPASGSPSRSSRSTASSATSSTRWPTPRPMCSRSAGRTSACCTTPSTPTSRRRTRSAASTRLATRSATSTSRRTTAARPARATSTSSRPPGRCAAVGYDGWLTIEAFGTALPALAAATKVWRDFFPSREEVYEHGLRTMREALGRGRLSPSSRKQPPFRQGRARCAGSRSAPGPTTSALTRSSPSRSTTVGAKLQRAGVRRPRARRLQRLPKPERSASTRSSATR